MNNQVSKRWRRVLLNLASFAAALAVGVGLLMAMNVQVFQPWTSDSVPAASVVQVLQAGFADPSASGRDAGPVDPTADEGEVIQVLKGWMFTRVKPSLWTC